jgi:hypothetical protein
MKSMSHWSQQADRRADRRHAKQVAALLHAVLDSPGATDPAVRQAVYQGESQSEPVGEYLEKILLESGMSQDAVFELTVVAALGAAAERLEAGMRAMREGY